MEKIKNTSSAQLCSQQSWALGAGFFLTHQYRKGTKKGTFLHLYIIERFFLNPLVPGVQKINVRNLTLNQLPIFEFAKKMVYLGAHYSERQGIMG